MSARVRKAGSVFLSVALATVLAFTFMPARASAHCDSAQGPVVTAAKKALETGEIKWALAYVQPGAEAEMTAAFGHALEVRKLGDKAQELADQYFAETTVRLHRVGEGAGYTGIKENPEITPGLEAAEVAVAGGSLDEVNVILDKAVRGGVEEYWHRVVEAQQLAAAEGTVAALREKAEAELLFEKLVYGIEQAALGLAGGEEGDAAGGHSHGSAAPHEGEKGERPVGIHVKGAELNVKGVAVDGEALVPLRAVAEALGAQVAWDEATHTATVTAGAHELVVHVGSLKARVNGQELALPLAPALHNESVVVPAHLMAEFLELQFAWHAAESLVEYAAH